MQTFLPYPDFRKSAECLDWQYGHNRLNNQINEGIVILKSLLGMYPEKNGIIPWSNHPAVLMWKHYEKHLYSYTMICLETWRNKKGYKDIIDPRTFEIAKILEALFQFNHQEKPFWLGDPAFHSAHRSILLAKMPSWYGQFGWTEQPAVKNEKNKWPYVWPVQNHTTKENVI